MGTVVLLTAGTTVFSRYCSHLQYSDRVLSLLYGRHFEPPSLYIKLVEEMRFTNILYSISIHYIEKYINIIWT